MPASQGGKEGGSGGLFLPSCSPPLLPSLAETFILSNRSCSPSATNDAPMRKSSRSRSLWRRRPEFPYCCNSPPRVRLPSGGLDGRGRETSVPDTELLTELTRGRKMSLWYGTVPCTFLPFGYLFNVCHSGCPQLASFSPSLLHSLAL